MDRNAKRNLFLQLCDQIIGFIKSGKLPPGTRLPSTRKLALALEIHRKTVIAAYEELQAQGWIETLPAKGTYVTSTLPVVTPQKFTNSTTKIIKKDKSNFSFFRKDHLENYNHNNADESTLLKIDDGAPDHRLAPIEDISKIYRNVIRKEHYKHLLTYNSEYGNINLRKALALYLNQTRGLPITMDNVLITRGSQMGIFLTGQLLLSSKRRIVVGNTNYMTADNTFEDAGGIIERVSVDKNGLDTKQIEILCREREIAAVYVTSHHHHPTTVTLSAQRRMHLLQLAQQYKFAIIEDDYDYDFHYGNAPILPLASNDYNGNVLYIGGLTKIVAPALRIGYLVAPVDFVNEAAKLRKVIDRQGDTILEQTLTNFINTGDLQRHSTKVLKIYKKRRDLFCSLLQEKLKPYFDFEIPQGGMAIWIKLHKKYSWNDVVTESLKLNLKINPDWQRYDNNNSGHNGIRFGFASLNEEEIVQVVERLLLVMKKIEKHRA